MNRVHALLGATIAILIAVAPLSRSNARDGGFGRSPFELSVGQALDDEGNMSLVVNVSVPYRRLVFLKRAERYEARFRIYVNVKGGKGKQVRGEVWEESVMVEDYDRTKSGSARASARRDFPVEAGEYKVEVTVEVIDTSLKYTRERDINILGRERGKFKLADPTFFTPSAAARSEHPPAGEIVVNPCGSMNGSRFVSNADAVYADFGVWSRAAFNLMAPAEAIDKDTYTVSSQVRDSRGKIILYNRTVLRASASGYQQLCVDIDADGLSIGDYDISAAVELPNGKQRAVSKGRFTVLLNRGSLGAHFRETMEILSLYADEKELKELEASTPENRVDTWNRFWREKDPNPSTRLNESLGEFLVRLEHVLRSFSNFQPGWRTDRGKIYLRYGQPDDIADRQGRTFGTNYQIWYYYSRGIVYVFEDMLGTGDYRLLETRMI